ncbi:aminotransferase class I/II-fold pyridoxal phosphate-dependent enzyme [Herbaspirillum sp. GCM10030257]|uniref:aminotransferase class I/II-fold pyridoxal phosphate-dependent enzyme n=1 Tax=Herbaspirillum sp. GCM10030257 TaxID=3273393 RepID=UPI00361CBF94
MLNLTLMNRQELTTLREGLLPIYDDVVAKGLKLNMARGKPAPEQLTLSQSLITMPQPADLVVEDGIDVRNYGGIQGLLEARRLFSFMVGVPADQVVLGDNSSLAMMYDCIGFAWRHGFCDSDRPWGKESSVSFLCAVPGYDRHYRICEDYGINLIPVQMNDDGPDVEAVKRLVASDSSIRGMWCVPKYSNPTGTVYSNDVIESLASMPTAASDFKLFWDNAYSVHHLTDERVEIANIVELCTQHGHPHRALVYASTSKITLAGAGVAIFGSSQKNVQWLLKHTDVRTVGPDKINQLRHVRFLKDQEGIHALMEQHRQIMAPKFNAVLSQLECDLSGRGIAKWTMPRGGYFISLEIYPGCAKRVVELAAHAGVVLTTAGAPYPAGHDPQDSNIRIAPSLPSLNEIRTASKAIGLCVLLAATEKLISKRQTSAFA